MTPRERMLAAIRGDTVDRVPLDLPGFRLRTREQVDQLADPRARQLGHRVFEHVAWFHEVPSRVNRCLVTPSQCITTREEALSGGVRRAVHTIDTPRGPLTQVRQFDPAAQTWWTVKNPVESMDDIDRIRSVRWEAPIDLAPPEGAHCTDGFERRGILSTSISSPVVCVAGMMNYEWFLELALTEPEVVAELTEICRRRILAILDMLLSRPGIEYVWIGGSEWVTPPMASPAIYDALVQEQERRIIEAIHQRGDIITHVHCHGRVRHALSRMIERGVDYTEPVEPPPDGDITMAEAKALAAGRIALGGNVECRVLCNESVEAVDAAARAAFEGGSYRLVLRPSEEQSPVMSERELANYMRMVDVWEELSPVS